MMSQIKNSSLNGKTFVVVGAAGNLGPIWCSAILESGGRVIGIGLNLHTDRELAQLIHLWDGKLILFEQDISQPLDSAILDSVSSLGVSGVILNAGIDSTPGMGHSDITHFDYEFWVKVLSVNVAAVVTTLNALISKLSSGASVVFIGSMYALISPNSSLYDHYNQGSGSIKNPAYGASKAALIAVCNQYATEFGANGIRFNILTLGGIEGNQDTEFKNKFRSKVPLARMGTTGEIGRALTFLLSNDSSYMTGHNLVLDGGFTKW
jgi:NAD(P)-dependent dehydrogenase (short-subunit alcohol dehydrogenase family)